MYLRVTILQNFISIWWIRFLWYQHSQHETKQKSRWSKNKRVLSYWTSKRIHLPITISKHIRGKRRKLHQTAPLQGALNACRPQHSPAPSLGLLCFSYTQFSLAVLEFAFCISTVPALSRDSVNGFYYEYLPHRPFNNRINIQRVPRGWALGPGVHMQILHPLSTTCVTLNVGT